MHFLTINYSTKENSIRFWSPLDGHRNDNKLKSRYRNKIKLGTWNVRSMNDKQGEIILKIEKLDYFGVTETKKTLHNKMIECRILVILE